MKKLLLHVCCGPDLTYSYEYFSALFSTSCLFTNSNIDTETEYEKRFKEAERVSLHYGFEIGKDEYLPEIFEAAAAGLEMEKERGRRCEACHRMNLRRTADAALKSGADGFATTLTISPHKDSLLINRIGREVSEEKGVSYIESDLKKNGGFLRSVAVSKEMNLYRQNYCGCKYSKGDL